MADLQFSMTAAERDFLTELLDKALKDMRIEEHRTRAPSFREHVIRHEEMISSLLTKLGKKPE